MREVASSRTDVGGQQAGSRSRGSPDPNHALIVLEALHDLQVCVVALSALPIQQDPPVDYLSLGDLHAKGRPIRAPRNTMTRRLHDEERPVTASCAAGPGGRADAGPAWPPSLASAEGPDAGDAVEAGRIWSHLAATPPSPLRGRRARAHPRHVRVGRGRGLQRAVARERSRGVCVYKHGNTQTEKRRRTWRRGTWRPSGARASARADTQ